jgi:hypothetical protein
MDFPYDRPKANVCSLFSKKMIKFKIIISNRKVFKNEKNLRNYLHVSISKALNVLKLLVIMQYIHTKNPQIQEHIN